MTPVARSISMASPNVLERKSTRLLSRENSARSPNPVSFRMCGGKLDHTDGRGGRWLLAHRYERSRQDDEHRASDYANGHSELRETACRVMISRDSERPGADLSLSMQVDQPLMLYR